MDSIEVLCNILMSSNIVDKEDELFNLIPELKAEVGFEQKNKWHKYDVWGHTLAAVDACDNCFEDKVILLLHDIGKPFCFQDDGNVRHFKGHAEKSAEMANIILKRLGFNDDKVNEMCLIIKNHSNKIDLDDLDISNLSYYYRLLKIQQCDACAYEDSHALSMLKSLRNTKYELDKYFDDFKLKIFKKIM